VRVDAQQNLISKSISKADGVTLITWERKLVLSDVDSTDLDIIAGTNTFIIAWGSGSGPANHGANKQAVTLDLLTCDAGTLAPDTSKKFAHGFLMTLGWGVLIPTGVTTARYFKHRPIWMKIHKGCNVLGLLLALAAFILACSEFSTVEKAALVPLVSLNAHATIGIFVMVLGLLQPLNAFFRPHPEPLTVNRKLWNMLHWTSGRVATILGMLNCILGVSLAVEQDGAAAGYTFIKVILALWYTPLICFWIYAEARLYLAGHQPDSSHLLSAAAAGNGASHSRGGNSVAPYPFENKANEPAAAELGMQKMPLVDSDGTERVDSNGTSSDGAASRRRPSSNKAALEPICRSDDVVLSSGGGSSNEQLPGQRPRLGSLEVDRLVETELQSGHAN
jgi:hypothetical protein